MEEEDYDEEESLVLVELSGIIGPEFLQHRLDTCTLLGVEDEKPILKLGHYIFEGQYEDTLGTCVIFEEEVNADNDDSNSEGEECGKSDKKNLAFFDMTTKKLNMTRVFLKEKTSAQEEDSEKK